MDTEHICPSCRKPLPANAPKGLCPECLMKAGFGSGVAPEPGQPSRTPAFVPPAVAEVAKLFPQFEIMELLGQGGMGAVYKARQPALDRLVALKVLPPQTGVDAGFADRFTREARALARLSHPNIVAVHEFGQAGGLHYFVMEYVEGLNLRQLEQAGRLSPREALKIIPQICDALQFAHDEGIVHRDIKPENVMLDKKGRVKITDFGLAKILGREPTAIRLTGAKDVMGTPHYMAPEQIEHPQEVDHRADIYSLGVVFYEMLTGELPLGKFQAPSKKVQVDVRLDEVVLHALEKEPERRYQQASQVKTDVETIATTAPKLSMPVKDSPRPAHPPVLGATQQQEPRFTADSVQQQFMILAVCWWIGYPLSIVSEFVGWLNVITMPAIVIASVFWCILLYRHWSLLQGHGARTTPGKAVGYGFIPVFWFYWWFVAYAGLATDNNRYLRQIGITSRRMSFGLAVTDCVLCCLLWTVGWFPVGWSVLIVPYTIIGFILVVQQRDCVLAMLQHRAQPRGVGVPADQAQPVASEAPWASGAEVGTSFATAQGGAASGAVGGALVGSPRMSRAAMWGAVWAPTFMLAAAFYFLVVNPNAFSPGPRPPSLVWWQIVLGLILGNVGLTAPFGTTILGGIAISQIRHSQGRLYGLGLALFDVLLFPLLALNGGLIGAWSWLADQATAEWMPHLGRAWFSILVVGLMITSCVVVSWLITWVVWRSANRAPGSGQGGFSAGASAPRSGSAWRSVGIVAAVVLALAVLAGVLSLALYLSSGSKQQRVTTYDGKNAFAVQQKLLREVVGRLEAAGYRWDQLTVAIQYFVNPDVAECTIEGLRKLVNAELQDGSAAQQVDALSGGLDIRHTGDGLWAVRGSGDLTDVNFTVDTAAEMGPTTKLVTLPPRPFQYSKPEATDSAVSLAVRALRFGPVREVTLNDIDDLRGGEALDFDSGQLLDLPKDIEKRPKLEQLQWLSDQSADLLLDRVDGKWGLMTTTSNELKLAPLGNESWDAVAEQSLSKALGAAPANLEVKQRDPWLMYVLATNAQPPLTFAFGTASGTTGLLQITRFIEAPNSARLRYKLVMPGTAGDEVGLMQREFMRRYGLEAGVPGAVLGPASGVPAVEERPALLAQAAPGEYRVKVTNGVEFEVVAVASSPRSATVWWRPDGRLMSSPPGDRLANCSRYCPSGRSSAEFAVLVKGAEKEMTEGQAVMAFEPQPQYVESAILCKTNSLRQRKATMAGFRAAPETLTCKLGLANGEWERVATWDQVGTLLNNASGGTLQLIRSGGDDQTCLKLQHEIDPNRFGLRLTARLKDGTYKTALICRVEYSSGHRAQTCAIIQGLLDSEVVTYELYRLPLRWAVVSGIATRPNVPPIQGNTTGPGLSGGNSRLEDLSVAQQGRAVELLNDIEDFGHEFEAAFQARNLVAAQTGTRRLLNLLTNFNAIVKGTGYEFPTGIFDSIAKVRQALDEGDWEKAQEAGRHNDQYAREFKRIGARMAELAQEQRGGGEGAFGPVIEQAIAGAGDANKRFIDLDKGRLFAAAEYFGPKAEPSPEETQKWLKETGIDAVADTRSLYGGLVGFNLLASPVPSEEWDRLPPSPLDYYLAMSTPGTPVTMTGKGGLPATFAVRTREGAQGLLQIVGINTNNPPEVRVRYKLVRATAMAGNAPDGAVEAAKTNLAAELAPSGFAPADVLVPTKDDYVQREVIELLPDGRTHFRMTVEEVNNSEVPWETYRFVCSDFVNVTNIADARYRPMRFETTHESGRFHFFLTLNEPVLPGRRLSVTTEGIATGQITPTGAPGVFEYAMRHWPMTDHRTRRIELHRLPPGARLLDREPSDLDERVRDGRVELFINRLIPTGDSLEIIYHYRLDAPPATNVHSGP